MHIRKRAHTRTDARTHARTHTCKHRRTHARPQVDWATDELEGYSAELEGWAMGMLDASVNSQEAFTILASHCQTWAQESVRGGKQ